MKVLRISHVGVVPKDTNIAKDFFGTLLGITYQGSETVEEQKVCVDFFSLEHSRIELLAPTATDSPIAKFLEQKGSGIQHIALEVDDLSAWLDYLQKKGVQLIDKEPRRGAHGTQIAFVHPRATGGTLVELVQEKNT